MIINMPITTLVVNISVSERFQWQTIVTLIVLLRSLRVNHLNESLRS